MSGRPPHAPGTETPLAHILAPVALLADGWARDVLLEIGDDGSILSLRRDGRADAPRGTETLEGPVLPGLQNVHSHAFQRAMVGLTERGSPTGDTFWSWREKMYAFLDRLDPDAVEAVAAQLYVEMLEAGYTAVGEFHYLHHDRSGRRYDDPAETSLRIVQAARSTGIGLAHMPVLYMTGDFGGAPTGEGQRRFLWDVDGILDVARRVRDELAPDPDRRVGLALHSLRAVPPDAVAPALEGLRTIDPDAPVHIHVAEQRREVEACLAWSGRRPVDWLLDHAPVDRRWCLVHATHLDDGEVRRLAASGASAGLCPTTEANLGDGLFPLRAFLDVGGEIAVGSDSHVSVSPVEELRWLEYGQRLRARERNVAAGPRDRSTGRVLLDATVAGGERAMARGAGGLEAGRRADLVVLDPDHPRLLGRHGDTLLDAWIFGADARAVTHVMVGGRWVVRDGRHPERERVAKRYGETVRALA